MQRRGASVSGGLVLLDDAGRYAAAVRQLDLVGPGPGPDGFEIQVASFVEKSSVLLVKVVDVVCCYRTCRVWAVSHPCKSLVFAG